MKDNVFGIKAPAKPELYDKNCPFYGQIEVKREFIEGTVIKKDTSRSATIEWHSALPIPKYERFATKRSRIRVHNPSSINAQVGDRVLVARTRPLSKTKHHVILQVLRHGMVAASTLAQQEQIKIIKEKVEKARKEQSHATQGHTGHVHAGHKDVNHDHHDHKDEKTSKKDAKQDHNHLDHKHKE